MTSSSDSSSASSLAELPTRTTRSLFFSVLQFYLLSFSVSIALPAAEGEKGGYRSNCRTANIQYSTVPSAAGTLVATVWIIRLVCRSGCCCCCTKGFYAKIQSNLRFRVTSHTRRRRRRSEGAEITFVFLKDDEWHPRRKKTSHLSQILGAFETANNS